MNCIKKGLPGKLILRFYFQENRTSRRPFLLLRISFPGRPIFIQLPPVCPVASEDAEGNLIVCEEIYANLEKTTGLPRADILFAHATDRYSSEWMDESES